MDENTLETILKIDNEAKDNVSLIEKKNNEIEKYITQEITVKEAAMEAKYKDEILNLKQKYEEKLKEVEEKIKFKTNAEIENSKRKFEESKNKEINEIISNIINMQ